MSCLQIKAVTLKGALISKSGNMTGGTTTRDLDRAGQWDEKDFAELKKKRQELESERDTLSREHRNRSLKVYLARKGDESFLSSDGQDCGCG